MTKKVVTIKKYSMPVSINVILLALGICLLLWADKLTSLISIIIGAMFIACAAYNFFEYSRAKERNISDSARLITGILLAVGGSFLIIQNGFIKEVISIFVGIFLLLEGIFRLQDSQNSKSYNPNYKNSTVLAVISIVCGALCMFGKIIVPDIMLQVLGVLLIIFAITDMTGGIMVKQSFKSNNKTKTKVVNAKIIEK